LLSGVLFYVFAAFLIAAALGVITTRNPVHAVLFLVLAFVQSAALWLLIEAEFLAIVLVLVYVGAVMVLFLFVVMMLDINIDRMREGFWGYLPVASGVGALIVLEMAAVLWRGFLGQGDAPAESAVGHIGGTHELGRLIYTQYIYGFEIAGLILLVAIIAAVALTLRKRKDTKAIDPGLAVRVKRNDRLKIVKMQTVNQKAIDDAAIAAAAAAAATANKEAQ
jgi:NADH-quinone oxidoreductase subunit J